ncbi:MAG: glutamine--fructose-6-phosphate transaminase (isomerizing) [Alphaproteobacteria bacterium]|nr:glutamine--fructose-6-phosphate transaminase (isomerizing) [Alphaproteobacteria bacterium]
MCGIVGIVGTGPVANRLHDALQRLEYRGYDSAGVATLEPDGTLVRRRAEGKLANLSARLEKDPLAGAIGIGHTRWATHGAPTEANAHPHMSASVAVVHNGIIENFAALRDELAATGYPARTETDTEIVTLSVTRELDRGATPGQAVAKVLPQLKGAFALAFLFRGFDDLLIAARQGSPLAIGHGRGEMFIGSDAFALAPFTAKITYLEEGDRAEIHRDGMTIFDVNGKPVDREQHLSAASALMVDKGNHRHFMSMEIDQQPEAVSHTLAHYLDMANNKVDLREQLPFDLAGPDRLTITACGTAFYAGLVAKYWFERYARLPVDVDVASEFRYREPPLEKGGVSLVISQSGETADTLAALRYARAAGQHVMAMVNVAESTIARESDVIFPTLCGPEIGVASTKAFTSQLAALGALVVAFGRARGHIKPRAEAKMVAALTGLPGALSEALKADGHIEAVARVLSRAGDVLYIGRGTAFPLALEGALKLKELSYIHAEAYPAGELKHGPIALIDEGMPVVVVATTDELMEKTISNMHEVAARGAKIILITDRQGAALAGNDVAEIIVVPRVDPFVAPIVNAVAVQLLAYHTAVHMGTDVDQPRNLAKSVTVE